MLNLQKPLEDYVHFFQNLNPRSLNLLDQIVHEDVVFRDPFHDVRGVLEMKKIFIHMFNTTENPKFQVIDRAFGKDEFTAYLKWRFTARAKSITLDFIGMSEVTFDTKGRVISHIDYWDSASEFYSRISILRPLFSFLRKKAAS